MTTKTITGNYYPGYTVAAGVTALYAEASISGATGTAGSGASGGAGGVALTSAHGAYVRNTGVIIGGIGGAGGVGQSSSSAGVAGLTGYGGGAGGAGVSLTGGTITNSNQIFGGAGGKGGQGGAGGSGANGGAGGDGGAGGAAVTLSGAMLTNLYFIVGGAGGAGGAGGHGGVGGGDGGVGAGGKSGDGVDVAGGGTVVNGSSTDGKATIQGDSGVRNAGGGVMSVTNYGKITGATGALLGFGDTLANKAGATISGSYAAVFAADPSTIFNDGTLQQSGGGNYYGVAGFGGILVNGGSSDSSALIAGDIEVGDTAPAGLIVTNYATISGTVDALKFNEAADRLIAEAGSTFIGAVLGGGGTLELASGVGAITGIGATGTISGAASMTFSGFGGYVLDKTSAWTVSGTNTDPGATLTNAGQLSNTGLLDIHVTGQGGMIINRGTVESSSAGVGMIGGALTNGGPSYLAALVTGGAYGVYAGPTATASVVNYATITATGSGSQNTGVWLHGGSVKNGDGSDQTALIKGVRGVYLESAATLTNYGTVDGTGGVAVRFANAGDRLIAEAGSTVIGAVTGGGGTLELASGTGTITGLGATGTISGAEAMTFSGFGSYVVDAGSSWTLAGADTIVGGDTMTNNGTVSVTGALVNQGAINGGSTSPSTVGVSLAKGGSLTNQTKGVITGYYGVSAAAGASVTNLGTIKSNSTAILAAGVSMADGTLTNGSLSVKTALIQGSYGVYGGPAGSAEVVNYGTIAGIAGAAASPTGVDLFGGGSLRNGAATDRSALVEGVARGVYARVGQAVTVTNFGTLEGSKASVDFNASSDRLIAEAGSTFKGGVAGGGGTLELANGTGTIRGLGGTGTISGAEAMTFSGFGSYVTDAGGTWTLAGTDALAHGQTLTTNGVVILSGSLDNHGVVAGSEGAGKTGVEMSAGGRLTNEADGQISGYYGVDSKNSFTVTNLGTISGGSAKLNSTGVNVFEAHVGAILTLTNGAASNHGALIQAYANGLFSDAQATVSNYGTIRSTHVSSAVLYGGVLRNGSAADAAALIEGATGVYQRGSTALVVTNFATIEGTGGAAVQFSAAGSRLIAEAGSKLIGGAKGGGGTLELAGGSGTLTGLGAAGTISGGIAMTFSGFGSYVLDKGSSWTLAGTETIAAGHTLTNAGTATVTGAVNVAGSLLNIGQINGSVASASAAGAIGNLGTITNGVGMNSGSLTNGSAADTTALVNSGAYAVYANTSGPATVINFGTIQGGGGGGLHSGVWLNGGGAITNGSASDSKAVIEGFIGAQAFAALLTVTNFGTIDGTGGVALHLGSSSDRLIDEAGSTVIGTVQGGGTLELAKGTGTIAGLGTSFTGFGQYRIDSGGTWTMSGSNTLAAGDTLTNAGRLTVTGSLANLGRIVGEVDSYGGAITNGSAADTTASITGASDGVSLSGAKAVSVTNFGTIAGTASTGVRMQYEGSLTNGSATDTGALVSGGVNGFYANFPSNVTNFGSIIGKTGIGVRLGAGGVVNGSATDAKAVISGAAQGVYVKGAATLTNYGVIKGAVSVEFKNATDRLIDEAGSALTGVAQGGGGTLELAKGTGTVSGLGKNFTGFATYQVDVGATWTLSGTNTLAKGTTLTDKGTLIDTGPLTLSAGAKLAVANGGVLQIEGAVSNAGTIALTSTGAQTNLRVLAAGATLSGGGTVSLSGSKAGILGASSSATLTNADNTISGAGFIGAAQLTLVNEAAGVIDANAKGGIVLRTDGKTLANAGLIEATGAGLLDIVNTTVDNSKGGKITAAARVDIQNSDIIGGTMTSSGAGVLVVNALGAVLDGTAGHAVTMSGRLYLLDNTSLTLEGSIIDKGGTVTVAGGAHQTQLLVAVAGATLSGGGTLDLTNRALNHIDAVAAGAVLTNLDNHIVGAGTIGDANLTLINDAAGFITSNNSVALTLDTGAHAIVNAGRIDGQGKGGTIIQGAVNNTGLLVALHGDLTVNGAVTGAGSAEILGGTLAFASSFTENVTFTTASPNGVLQLAQSVNYGGTITGFAHTNVTKLDLRDIAFLNGSTKATATWSQSTGILTVPNGAKTAHIHLAGNYTTSTFTTADDTHGGVFVTDPPASPAASPHPASAPRPLHPFVAAMAGFAPGAQGALAATHETWRPPPLTLAAVRAQMA